jgi:hypothetical protein
MTEADTTGIVERLREEIETLKSPKRAPVQGFAAGIPWEMHLRAYDVYCKRYGQQESMIDLEGKNCRGGFGTSELDDFIPGWRDELTEIGRLKSEIASLTSQLEEARAKFLTLSEFKARYMKGRPNAVEEARAKAIEECAEFTKEFLGLKFGWEESADIVAKAIRAL